MDISQSSYDFLTTEWADIVPHPIAQLANDLAEKSYSTNKVVFPPKEKVFIALRLTQPKKVRCVIVGQDPYHEHGQANGLAFSVEKGVKIPPSLRNIFKELHADIGCNIPTHGDLSAWGQQGVLLLNSRLTVEEGKPNTAEFAEWQTVTQAILKAVWNLPQPIVFLLWGKNAISLLDGFDLNNKSKTILCSTHPSPLSANRSTKKIKAFVGCSLRRSAVVVPF